MAHRYMVIPGTSFVGVETSVQVYRADRKKWTGDVLPSITYSLRKKYANANAKHGLADHLQIPHKNPGI
jgi:hypothetical protein